MCNFGLECEWINRMINSLPYHHSTGNCVDYCMDCFINIFRIKCSTCSEVTGHSEPMKSNGKHWCVSVMYHCHDELQLSWEAARIACWEESGTQLRDWKWIWDEIREGGKTINDKQKKSTLGPMLIKKPFEIVHGEPSPVLDNVEHQGWLHSKQKDEVQFLGQWDEDNENFPCRLDHSEMV